MFQEGYRRLEQTKALPEHVRHAAWALLACRTAVLGGHIQVCPEGHFQRAWYNSCKHRVCPQCAFVQVEQWLSQQKERLLRCEHFHVIFTIPSELNALWLIDPRLMTSLLFRSVKETLFEMLEDQRHLGARPGVIAALHTWGQTLVLHPHVHCLVTGGGLDEQGQWRKVNNGFLLPSRAAMALFRGKLLDAVRNALLEGQLEPPKGMRQQQVLNLLNKLGRKKWNVRIRERYAHGEGVAMYLSRYLRGGPISNRRLVSLKDGEVTFRYKEYREEDASGRAKRKIMTLPVEVFLQRFLLHVPMPHTQVVRSYGLYANSKGADLNRCRAQLGQPPVEKKPLPNWQDCCSEQGEHHPELCPTCGCRLVMGQRLKKEILRLPKGPNWRKAA